MAVMQTERIQTALVEIGRNGPWYPRRYDPTTGTPDVDLGREVKPQSIFCKETSASFVPAHTKRQFKRDSLGWTFELSTAFQEEISTETFENRLCDEPPFIPADGAFRLVQILLVGKRVIHPPQQQPGTGTRAWFTFHAEQTPK